MTTTLAYRDLPRLQGADLGWSEWLTVTQEHVNLFAEATDDHQWIHVDPERAKTGPFGGPIAHGYLTLALADHFWPELFGLDGDAALALVGLERVRFVTPVPVGARVRMNAVVAEVLQTVGGYEMVVDKTIVIDRVSKPAVVARARYRIESLV